MRASSAVLTDSSIRLWDLVFPASRPLLARTRAAYVHVDGLIAYSKRDRDGKVDAYLACYRPDEVALLFFQKGDVTNAAILTPSGRFPIAISEALKHIRAEPERAEIAFHQATTEQLAAMYASCAQKPAELGLDASSPLTIFQRLLERKWSGVLELISNARVNYLLVKEGHFSTGMFADKGPNEAPTNYVARLFTSVPPEPLPIVTAKGFEGLPALPQQAAPALVHVFRTFVWDLTDFAEREAPGDAARRADRVRAKLLPAHDVLRAMGGARGTTVADPIAEPGTVADAVAAWTKEFLTELEVVHPKIAPRLLKEAGREQRFALNAVGFFERLPWHIDW